MKNIKKSIKIIYFGLGLLVIILVIYALVFIKNNPERLNMPVNQIIVEENDNINTVNLCVVKKESYYGGMTGIFTRYYLVLSNDMIVDVSKQDFNKYEENQYYDFELVERTTVTQRIRIKE